MITTYGNTCFNDVDGDVWEDEPEPVYKCECCGERLYAGDDYFSIEDKIFCYSCADRRCEDILAAFGAEEKEIILPRCDSCGNNIIGRYKIFRGKKYCEDCIADYGADLVEEIFHARSAMVEWEDRTW